MTRPKTDTERADRRAAGKALAEAKRAAKETRKLAKTLSRDAGATLAAVEASVRAEIREAKREVGVRPRRAERMAKNVSARLEGASMRMTPYADAATDAKRRAKTIKRHLEQAKQVRKMAKFVALHAIVTSVVTPTDEQQRKADEKRRRRPSGAEMDTRGVLPVAWKRAKSR